MATVALKDLAPVVAFVSAFVSERDPAAPASFLWFSGKKVRAYSGTSGAEWALPTPVGDFAVHHEKLSAFLASLRDDACDAVDLEPTSGGARLTLTVKKAGAGKKYHFPLYPPDLEAPKEWIERSAPKGAVDVDDDWWVDVGKVRPAASSDEGKPFMRGVYWAPDGRLVACDNVRVTLCSATKAPPGGKGVLVPLELLAALGPSPSFGKAAAEESCVWFLSKSGAAYGRLASVDFPPGIVGLVEGARKKVESEKPPRVEFTVDPTSALERLLLFARKEPYTVRVRAEKSAVRLSFAESDGDGQSGEEVVAAKIEGAGEVDFNVDGRMFRDAVGISPCFWYSKGTPLYFHTKGSRVEHVLSTLVTQA